MMIVGQREREREREKTPQISLRLLCVISRYDSPFLYSTGSSFPMNVFSRVLLSECVAFFRCRAFFATHSNHTPLSPLVTQVRQWTHEWKKSFRFRNR